MYMFVCFLIHMCVHITSADLCNALQLFLLSLGIHFKTEGLPETAESTEPYVAMFFSIHRSMIKFNL